MITLTYDPTEPSYTQAQIDALLDQALVAAAFQMCFQVKTSSARVMDAIIALGEFGDVPRTGLRVIVAGLGEDCDEALATR